MNKISKQLIKYLNLLPLLGLFMFLTSKPKIIGNLGFGLGIVISIIPLSIYFFIKKMPIGFFVVMLLYIFVDISYYLPIYDQVLPSMMAFISEMLLIFIWIMLSYFSMLRYLLIKPNESNFIQLSMLNRFYIKIPCIIISIGTLVALFLRVTHLSKFSIAFVSCQTFGWLVLLIYLSWLKNQGKINYDSLKSFIREENQISMGVSKKTVIINFILILLISSISEGFRGFWTFWILTAIWLSLISLTLWKIWRYAFE